MITTVPDQITRAPGRRVRTRVRALAVACAPLVALGVWTVAVPLLGADLPVRPGGGSPQMVGAGAVAAASLITALVGWALLALLEHRTARARPVWTAVALAVLLLSLGGPLTAGTTTASKAVLVLMHLTVGAVLIPALRRNSPTG